MTESTLSLTKFNQKYCPPSFHPPAFQPRFSEKFNTICWNIHFKVSLATDQRTQKCKIPALPAHKLQPTRYWGTWWGFQELLKIVIKSYTFCWLTSNFCLNSCVPGSTLSKSHVPWRQSHSRTVNGCRVLCVPSEATTVKEKGLASVSFNDSSPPGIWKRLKYLKWNESQQETSGSEIQIRGKGQVSDRKGRLVFMLHILYEMHSKSQALLISNFSDFKES